MRFRPGFDVPFLCVEAVLIGGHYAFPELPHALGLAMFWTGIAGLAAWGLVRLGVLDNIQIFQRWFGSATPARDVGVGEAIAYVCYRDWGHNFLAAAGSRDVDAVAALHEFRQAASDDRVKIWGKRSRDAVFEPISAEYWRRHQIEWFGLLKNSPTTEPTASVADRGNRCEELMTSRTQVEEVWPKPRAARARLLHPCAAAEGVEGRRVRPDIGERTLAHVPEFKAGNRLVATPECGD